MSTDEESFTPEASEPAPLMTPDELRQRPGQTLEYAIRYDAPADFAGIYSSHGRFLSIVESTASKERNHPQGRFDCTVVQRSVTYSEWSEVSS